jgi:uncharacterized protein (DUF885 family)
VGARWPPVRDSVYPAYAALLAFYRKEYAPRCRATASIASTPRGADYYAFRVRAETTTELTPEQVHQLGLREVARIGAEMDSVAAQAGHADRAAFVARLRDDPRYYARTPDELLSAAAVLAKRIDGELPRYFGRLPRLPYTVRRSRRRRRRSRRPRTTSAARWRGRGRASTASTRRSSTSARSTSCPP